MNVLFFVVMITGIVLAEVFFPKQGVRGEDNLMINRTGCFNESPGERPVALARVLLAPVKKSKFELLIPIRNQRLNCWYL